MFFHPSYDYLGHLIELKTEFYKRSNGAVEFVFLMHLECLQSCVKNHLSRNSVTGIGFSAVDNLRSCSARISPQLQCQGSQVPLLSPSPRSSFLASSSSLVPLCLRLNHLPDCAHHGVLCAFGRGSRSISRWSLPLGLPMQDRRVNATSKHS